MSNPNRIKGLDRLLAKAEKNRHTGMTLSEAVDKFTHELCFAIEAEIERELSRCQECTCRHYSWEKAPTVIKDAGIGLMYGVCIHCKRRTPNHLSKTAIIKDWNRGVTYAHGDKDATLQLQRMYEDGQLYAKLECHACGSQWLPHQGRCPRGNYYVKCRKCSGRTLTADTSAAAVKNWNDGDVMSPRVLEQMGCDVF